MLPLQVEENTRPEDARLYTDLLLRNIWDRIALLHLTNPPVGEPGDAVAVESRPRKSVLNRRRKANRPGVKTA